MIKKASFLNIFYIILRKQEYFAEMTSPSVRFNLVALGIKHSVIIGIIKLKNRNKAKCNNKPLILLH